MRVSLFSFLPLLRLRIVVATFVAPVGLSAQAAYVSGTVRDEAGKPVTAATVFFTAIPSRSSAQHVTTADGAFRFATVEGSSSYLLVARATGYADYRVTLGADSANTATITITLRATVATLAAVQVQARRARPARSMGIDGGFAPYALSEPVTGAVKGVVSPTDEGSLAALLSTLPGIFDASLGAYGLGADQTLVTINGVATSGALRIPLGAATSVQASEKWCKLGGRWIRGRKCERKVRTRWCCTLRKR